jgi:hypothetical protein
MGEKQDYMSSRREERIEHRGRTPDEIRSEIELTRSELTHTVDAIERKISPDRFVGELKKNIRYAGDYLQKILTEGGDALLKGTRSKSIPTVLTLIGVAWLIFEIAKQSKKTEERVPYPPSTQRASSEGVPYPFV